MEPSLLCIFCYKSVAEPKNVDSSQTETLKRLITLMFSHSRDCSKKEWSTGKFQEGLVSLKLKMDSKDFKSTVNMIQACQDCNTILEEFSELYHQIKCLELKLNWQVDRLSSVMKYADKVPMRMKQFKEVAAKRNLENLIGTGEKLLEFRRDFKGCCKIYHHSTFPRVLISPLPLKTDLKRNIGTEESNEMSSGLDSSELNAESEADGEQEPETLPVCKDNQRTAISPLFQKTISTTLEADKNESCGGQDSIEVVEESTGDDGELEATLLELQPSVRKEKGNKRAIKVVGKRYNYNLCAASFCAKYKLKKHQLRKHSTSSSWTCTICSIAFGTKFQLHQHTIVRHVEKYFLSSKLKFLAGDQFKKYVSYSVDQTIQSFGRPIAGSTKKTERMKYYKCGYCSKQHASKQTAKIHLVLKHRKVVKQNLIKLQETMTPDDLDNAISKMLSKNLLFIKGPRKMVPPSSSQIRSHIYLCTLCPKKFPEGFILRQHQASRHSEVFLPRSNPKLSDEEHKLYIEYLLKQQVSAFTKIERDGKNSANGKFVFQCSYCSKQVSSKAIARTHFVLMHSDIFACQLEQLQNVMTPEDVRIETQSNIKVKKVPKSRSRLRHRECSDCGKSFGSAHSLWLHRQKQEACQLEGKETENRISEDISPAKSTPHICAVCSKTFNEGFLLNQHEAHLHPETFFVASRFQNIDTDQFKFYVRHLINVEMKKVSRTEDESSGKVKLKCPYCPKHLSSKKLSQTHAVLIHEDILRAKLEELQRNKKPEDLVKIKITATRTRSETPKIPKCPKCGKTYSNMVNLRRHINGYCEFRDDDDTSDNDSTNSTMSGQSSSVQSPPRPIFSDNSLFEVAEEYIGGSIELEDDGMEAKINADLYNSTEPIHIDGDILPDGCFDLKQEVHVSLGELILPD